MTEDDLLLATRLMVFLACSSSTTPKPLHKPQIAFDPLIPSFELAENRCHVLELHIVIGFVLACGSSVTLCLMSIFGRRTN